MNYAEYIQILSHLFAFPLSKDTRPLKEVSELLAIPQSNIVSVEQMFLGVNPPFSINESGLISLLNRPDIYQKERIKLACTGIESLQVFLKIDSTNTYLKSLGSQVDKFSVCIAEQQTEGRGRRGKRWESPFGANVYFSLRTRVWVSPMLSGGVSLVVGLAIVKAIEGLGFNGLMIKWPNDIYVNGKKLGGILIEAVSLSHNFIEVVIGIGINVDMSAFNTKDIDQPWVDLVSLFPENTEIEILPSRNDIVVAIINQIEANLILFSGSGLSVFYHEWGAHDFLSGKEIKIKRENDVIYRTAFGINEFGELLVRDDDEVAPIHSGEVSVRLS